MAFYKTNALEESIVYLQLLVAKNKHIDKNRIQIKIYVRLALHTYNKDHLCSILYIGIAFHKYVHNIDRFQS